MSRLIKARAWSLSRLEIRAPASAGAHPVARVELMHCERGRASDVALGPGPLAAVCAAVNHLIGVDAEIEAIQVEHASSESCDSGAKSCGLRFIARIAARSGKRLCRADGHSDDLLTACVEAYVAVASDLFECGESLDDKRAHEAHMQLMKMNRGCCA